MDGLGIPRPEVSFEVDNYTRKGLEAAKLAHKIIFDKMQATQINHQENWFGAGHIMGTCKMGNDPNISVVNRDSHCHQHDNLYITGSSVFPTTGTGNPTLTLVALAIRAAKHIEERLGTAS